MFKLRSDYVTQAWLDFVYHWSRAIGNATCSLVVEDND
jgi:hypothetical protein